MQCFVNCMFRSSFFHHARPRPTPGRDELEDIRSTGRGSTRRTNLKVMQRVPCTRAARPLCLEILRGLAPPGLFDERLELADGHRRQVHKNGGKPIVMWFREEFCRIQVE